MGGTSHGEDIAGQEILIRKIERSGQTADRPLFVFDPLNSRNEPEPHPNKDRGIPPKANAESVDAMEDGPEVYHRPYDPRRPLIRPDEASKQPGAETRKAMAVEPGKPKRTDAEYRRCGTANAPMPNAPPGGTRHVRVRERRTRTDFADVVRETRDTPYEDDEKIVPVRDNPNTHNGAPAYETLDPAETPRLAENVEIHHTPKNGRRLNMAEIELNYRTE